MADFAPYAADIAKGRQFLTSAGRMLGNNPMNDSGYGVVGTANVSAMRTVRDLPTLIVDLGQKDAIESMAAMMGMFIPVVRVIDGPRGCDEFVITAVSRETYFAHVEEFKAARRGPFAGR